MRHYAAGCCDGELLYSMDKLAVLPEELVPELLPQECTILQF
jgi:hypothetical protein